MKVAVEGSVLRSFRVGNHKSIKGEAELLLMPAYAKTRPVVPVAAIFGANAAGKSNLLDALAWMQTGVRESFRAWEPGGGVPRRPFRLDPTKAGEPSLYAIELLIDEVRYMYGFVVGDDVVREEWLYTYPRNRKRVVFERAGQQWTFGSTVARAKADVVSELTRPNSLFLSVAARTDIADVLPVYQWFQQSLVLRSPGTPRVENEVVDFIARSDQHRRRLTSLVRAADLGIQDMAVPSLRGPIDELRRERVDVEGELRSVEMSFVDARVKYERAFARGSTADDDTKTSLAKWDDRRSRLIDRLADLVVRVHRLERDAATLQFAHGDKAIVLAEDDQSFGTLAWLRLLVPALTALEDGSVLCIDEIDSSLHPRLTARLVELFHNADTNPRAAQLIFTTHDATLLGTSFGAEILGRDEVWFVEKGTDGATRLFPLSDFRPRRDENTERRYLGGSYGAVPAVYSDTLVEELLASDVDGPGAAA